MTSQWMPPGGATTVDRGVYHMLVGACRVARTRGAARIGTDDVLVSMLRRSPELGGVPGFPARPAATTGTPPAPPVRAQDEHEAEALRTMRQAHWEVFGLSTGRDSGRSSPDWDAGAVAVVGRSLAAARSVGQSWAGGRQLFDALLADEGGAALRLLRGNRVDLALLDEAARRTWPDQGGAEPWSLMVDQLTAWGLLLPAGAPLSGRRRTGLLSAVTSFLGDASLVLAMLERAALIEAVRLGHARVSVGHLVVAVLRFEEETVGSGLRWAPAFAAVNAPVLGPLGLRYRDGLAIVAAAEPGGPIAAPKRGRRWRSDPRNPPWTAAAAQAADSARDRAGRGADAGSLHLLWGALSGADDEGRSLLRAMNGDPEAVRAEVSRHLDGGPTRR